MVIHYKEDGIDGILILVERWLLVQQAKKYIGDLLLELEEKRKYRMNSGTKDYILRTRSNLDDLAVHPLLLVATKAKL